METKIIQLHLDGKELSEKDKTSLKKAGHVLREGGLVAFPTETVYGLGGNALNGESSRRIYAAKGRPSDNPLIVHICRFEDIYSITKIVPEGARKLAQAFWPGPLTMILPKSDKVPYETTGGLETVAVRMPSHPAAREMIACAGGYVAAPSANASGRPSPTTALHVAEDMLGKIDMIVDGGPVGIGLESTIVDLTVSPPQILRPGYITKAMLEEVLGCVEEDPAPGEQKSGQSPRAPGMKYRHYAPRGELIIVEGAKKKVIDIINARAAQDMAEGKRTGVIGTKEAVSLYRADVVKSVGSRENEEEIAACLYAVLREFDRDKVSRIYSESFEAQGLGQAIMNRLLKAAGYRVEKAAGDASETETQGGQGEI